MEEEFTTIEFNNAKGEQIGMLDFTGDTMKFEGNAEESAIVFFNFLAQEFTDRLDMEYQRGINERKK